MKNYRLLRHFLFITVIPFLLLLSTSRVLDASGPWFVTSTGDDTNNDCLSTSTPCVSINGALAKPGFVDGDTIKVAIGTYYGTGSEVVLLNRSATLSGGWDATFTVQSGMSTIDGQGVRRGITVEGYPAKSVYLDRFVVTNGYASNTLGGGVLNKDGYLSVSNSTVSYNIAGTDGGGISNLSGALSILDSSITGNTANESRSSCPGGGGLSSINGSLTISKTTVSANQVLQGCPGAGIEAINYLILTNSTVSGNTGGDGIYAFNGASIYNSTISNNFRYGIYVWLNTANLKNSIISNNGTADCHIDQTYGGTLTSLGYNLIQNKGNCSLNSNDLSGIEPKLGPLQDNGGPTLTQALMPGPAINGGNPEGCIDNLGNPLNTDQRGMPRVGRCDIGAFEYQGVLNYAFLPLVSKPIPTPTPPFIGINGHVAVTGGAVAGVSLELRFYNGSAWSTIATTSTASDGSFSFLNSPSLSPGQYYYVRYLNPGDSNRLGYWSTRLLSAYTAGTNVVIGNFDLANIPLQSPSPGATISVDTPFQWGTRPATPSDSYEFNLFDPYNANTYWYTPPLGYTGSYAINHSLIGFNPHQIYGWYIGVYSPDGGYGESYYARGVYFDDTIAASQSPAPLKPRNIPGLNERRLPTLQRSR